MSEADGQGFVDFFWNLDGIFNMADTRPRRTSDTQVFYLHGGIHLYRSGNGETFKRFIGFAENLLEEVDAIRGQQVVPLLVSEGTSQQKLESIRNSNYLNFVYNSFSNHEGNLVIFGHSLEDSDDHLFDAIRRWREKELAISVFSDLTPAEKIAFIGRALQVFPHTKIVFFESNTHPLGEAQRRVPIF